MEIETDRLLLRLPQASDFDRYAETLANEDAARYIGGVQSRAGAWRRCLGSRNLGPGKLPAPYEDSPTDIWGQSREEWQARRANA